VVHLLGPPGTGKSHLAIARGVEAVGRLSPNTKRQPTPDHRRPPPGEIHFGAFEENSFGIDKQRRNDNPCLDQRWRGAAVPQGRGQKMPSCASLVIC
jgi:hypothetical protein